MEMIDVHEANQRISKYLGIQPYEGLHGNILWGDPTNDGDRVVLLKEMYYHNSWSWLMIAVLKINKHQGGPTICIDTDVVYFHTDGSCDPIHETDHTSMIECAYIAVNKAMIWHEQRSAR